jgi:hypothetical protein
MMVRKAAKEAALGEFLAKWEEEVASQAQEVA